MTQGEQGPPNQLNRAHMCSQRWKWEAWGPHGSVPGPLCTCHDYQLGVLVVLTPNRGSESVSLTLLPALGIHFLILSCLAQRQHEDACLVLSHLVLSCLALIPWRPALFGRGNGGRVDLREKRGTEESGW